MEYKSTYDPWMIDANMYTLKETNEGTCTATSHYLSCHVRVYYRRPFSTFVR